MLFYGGKWFPFAGSLATGRPVGLATEIAQEVGQWESIWVSRRTFESRTFRARPIVKNILFHDKLNQNLNQRNQVLGPLDQSWRLHSPNAPEVTTQEAILYARLPRLESSLDAVNQDPASPSRLILRGAGGIPQGGWLEQEGYVRVFLPVTPGAARRPD